MRRLLVSATIAIGCGPIVSGPDSLPPGLIDLVHGGGPANGGGPAYDPTCSKGSVVCSSDGGLMACGGTGWESVNCTPQTAGGKGCEGYFIPGLTLRCVEYTEMPARCECSPWPTIVVPAQ
jgi:hypothetical protein